MDVGIASTIQVEIADHQTHLSAPPGRLADLARRVLAGEGIERASVSVVLVDDASIRALNRQHLDHDWPTDVIAFRLSEPDDPELEAEVVLSVEMAATTARESGADAQAELALYLVHGLLHLCGHDDQDEAGSAAMRRREGEVLSALGLPNTFAMVGRNAGDQSGREASP